MSWVFDALHDDDLDLMNYGIEDIKISYDNDLNEGDYEISSKLSPSEIEKKKKEIKCIYCSYLRNFCGRRRAACVNIACMFYKNIKQKTGFIMCSGYHGNVLRGKEKGIQR